MEVHRMVKRGDASWSALPASAQLEMAEVATEMRSEGEGVTLVA